MHALLRLSALAAFSTIAASAMAETRLTFSTYHPPTYSVTACDTYFMDEVTKRTNGEVVFEKFYSSSLLSAVDTFAGLSRGAVDMANGSPSGYQRQEYPLSNIVIPFLTPDAIAATHAFNQLVRESEEFKKEYSQHNVKLLYAVIPIEHALWSRDPIRSIEDMKGKRIRSLLAVGDAISKMGATTVAMGFPDAVEAIARGAIDGLGNLPFDLAVSAGIYQSVKYGSDGGGIGIFAAQSTGMNLDTWNKLSPEIQKTVDEVAAEVPEKCWKDLVEKDLQQTVDKLKATEGVEVTSFPPEDAKSLRETVLPQLRDEWVAVVGRHGYDGEKLMDRFIELIAEHEKTSGYKSAYERLAAE